jgi:hypothetical protein
MRSSTMTSSDIVIFSVALIGFVGITLSMPHNADVPSTIKDMMNN